MVYSKLKKANATDYVIRTYEAFTSYSVVLAIPGVDRIFLHNPGTNNFFDSKDLSIDSLEDVALFHFGYPTLMKKMFENEGMEEQDYGRGKEYKEVHSDTAQ